MTTLAPDLVNAVRLSVARLKSAWTLVAGIPLAVAILDPDNTGAVVDIALRAFGGTLPFIVFAVGLIAYLRAAGAESVVARAFRGRRATMILFAALFGGLAPFCSCEVIPFIAGLLAFGAPISAVMAFWLSSPLIDPPTLLITAAALDWSFAIGKTVAAVSIGLLGGFAMEFAGRMGWFDAPLKNRGGSGGCGCGPSPFGALPRWRFWREAHRVDTLRSELIINGLFLAKWLMLAYLLEGLLITYVPADAIGGVVGGEGIWPIFVGAAVGAPAYLNSYAAPALVSGLIEQGMSHGAAMAFLVAGAISSIPAMTAVWSLVRRPVFAAYVGLGATGAILSGLAFAAFG